MESTFLSVVSCVQLKIILMERELWWGGIFRSSLISNFFIWNKDDITLRTIVRIERDGLSERILRTIKHSTNVRVYSCILRCIFFLLKLKCQFHINSQWNWPNWRKWNGDEEKKTLYIFPKMYQFLSINSHRKIGMELIMCKHPWLLYFPSEFNSKKRDPDGFLPSGIITSKLTDI